MRFNDGLKYSAFLFLCTLVVACSSGGDDGGTAASTDINIAGTWTITETSKPSNCEQPAPPETLVLQAEQDGTSSSVTIIDEEGNRFAATLNDRTLTWTGTYDQDAPDGTGGIITLNPMTATIDASCNSLTGTASWTWTATEGEPYSCTGTTNFTGEREPAIGCGTTTPPPATSTPTGIWEGTFTESGSVPVEAVAVIQGDQIRVVSEDAAAGLVGTISVSGTSFTASTTDYVLFGGPTGITTSLSGTFTAGSAISGTFTSSDGSSGTMSLTYDTVTDKGASLATIAASWVSSTTPLQFSIDNAGLITGTDGTCNFGGSVSIIDAAVNIYNMTLILSTCPGIDGTYGGYAAVSDTFGTNDTLNIILHDVDLMLVDQLFK
jgi:hypothetical protein